MLTIDDYTELALVAAERKDAARVRELLNRLAADAAAGNLEGVSTEDRADPKAKPSSTGSVDEAADAVTTDENGDPIIPPAEFNALTQDELVALMERDAELYQRSLRAAKKAAA